MGDAEGASLFERDALMFHAAKRRSMLETEHEGLVFGRLDIDHGMLRQAGNGETSRPEDREVRYIGRLGVRDDDYEPLVIDWRAPAASAVLPGDARRSRWACCAAACCAAAAPPSSASRTTSWSRRPPTTSSSSATAP